MPISPVNVLSIGPDADGGATADGGADGGLDDDGGGADDDGGGALPLVDGVFAGVSVLPHAAANANTMVSARISASIFFIFFLLYKLIFLNPRRLTPQRMKDLNAGCASETLRRVFLFAALH